MECRTTRCRVAEMRYKVRSGDVLGSIAKRYHVTVEQLRQWNGIRGNMIKAGQTLLIYSK